MQLFGQGPEESFWMSVWGDPLFQKLLWSLLALLIVYGAILLSRRLLNKAIKERRLKHKSRKFLYYLGTVVFLLILLGVWSERLEQLALTIGVLGAGLAFALQQPVVNFAGWLYILTRNPYDVGDRVEINGIAGDIIDIRLFKTVLLEIHPEGAGKGSQSTGRVADFPNNFLFSHTLFNYTRGFEFLWNEYAILVTFESNWGKAEQILSEIVHRHTHKYEIPSRSQLKQMARSYLIHYDNLTSMVYIIILDSGIELGLRYLTPTRGRRMIRDEISREILKAFSDEPDIELAYPTFRMFRRELEEGKIQPRNGETYDESVE